MRSKKLNKPIAAILSLVGLGLLGGALYGVFVAGAPLSAVAFAGVLGLVMVTIGIRDVLREPQ